MKSKRKKATKKEITRLALKKMYQKAKNGDYNNRDKVKIGKIHHLQVLKIKQETGFDLTGYTRVVSAQAIKKAIKSHGNARESLRGQVKLVSKDFEMIQDIIAGSEIVETSKTKQGLNAILYKKQIGDIYYYLEEIKGKKRMQTDLKTMYKIRGNS